MKIISTILIVLCATQFFGQEIRYETTDNGQEIGKSSVYYENGNIKTTRFYKRYYEIVNAESVIIDTYDSEADTVPHIDTLDYYDKFLWAEEYEYDNKNQLRRVIKYTSGEDPIILYGPNQEVGIWDDEFRFIKRVSDVAQVSLPIRNESEKVINLSPEFMNENFSTEQKDLVLRPDENTIFNFQLNIRPYVNDYSVLLKNDSISIEISVQTIGFHLESRDISPKNQLSVNDEFIYWRNGNEALLRIYDIEKENILKTFSLAREKTTIELDGINPGNYVLCKKDFSSDQEICCRLEIEK